MEQKRVMAEAELTANPPVPTEAADTPAPTPPAEIEPTPGPTAIESALDQPAAELTIPRINLLEHHEEEAPPPPEPPPAPPVPAPVETAKPSDGARRNLRLWLPVAGAVVVLLGGAAGYAIFLKQPASPTAAPKTATPTPKPSQPATPTPPPVTTPAPQTVTAPAVQPTANNPQTVTVRAPSGLWLRSTPDSSGRGNIIGWMPNGAQISVDQAGAFWWHGTYAGKPGYFAANYTH